MVAKTDQGLKVRFLDLVTSVMELVRDGKRDIEDVCSVLQSIKDGKKPTSTDVHSQLISWQNLYLEHGIKVDVTNLKIPASQPGFTRLILVPEGMTPNKAVALLKKKMKVWQYADNLDTITSVRDTEKTYAIWVRDRQEADEELKSLSADDLKEDSVSCLTLTERLLYELKFFTETQKHLDKTNYTLCASSRDPNGYVPCVGWDPFCGGVCVRWDGSRDRRSGGRARQVVS
ncbi:MAG: hypothetical protein UY12_C0039G0001 [Parcubacteria group bacterium GW2011_GWA2_47_8b]|uniref:Uncharacterized protein n=2 Tax=Parcubacteria group TaxID=1794811 RepID=A0A0G1T668_9BACT|nr:MAG: hypothetical protein UY02_C0003G0004 [Candidatus Giovannonibacteria bacterium GW2011_GWB1_47_6b]KKU83319.1 MAG: hypothetical protein UY12_C0039G0001 [Parcubacteria group bacterium GW2011_GWA2_47_8b]KKU95191.1 MAG: hypothetical protein UY24_C0002G0005 [Parcubacteria group bacterium GW2011_GWA1_48_11b]OGY63420.1 MAG: hypothetical protein A3E64_01785 [Candidatus Harrisonbacteria bacterium RIFCSPHIGHO2_12_FULL_48_16]